MDRSNERGPFELQTRGCGNDTKGTTTVGWKWEEKKAILNS